MSIKSQNVNIANWRPDRPYNDLPALPPKPEIETHAVLRQCITARAALGELKQVARLIPNQAMASMMPWVHSGWLRDSSVSSMRRMNVPPDCFARHQLNSADRADPTWNIPVGDGANRTRSGRSVIGSRLSTPPCR